MELQYGVKLPKLWFIQVNFGSQEVFIWDIIFNHATVHNSDFAITHWNSCCKYIPWICDIQYPQTWINFAMTGMEPKRPWWHHQMEIFSALLAICAGNSPVTGELPTQRPMTQSFGVFFDLSLNKRPSKQSWGWWQVSYSVHRLSKSSILHVVLVITTLIARFMGPTWGPSGTDRTQAGPCWPHEPCYLGSTDLGKN